MKTKKLRLNSETIRRLDTFYLSRAAGGASVACSVECTTLCSVKGPGCGGTGGGAGSPTDAYTCAPCSNVCETGGTACTAQEC
jgi:hypothetical protein